MAPHRSIQCRARPQSAADVSSTRRRQRGQCPVMAGCLCICVRRGGGYPGYALVMINIRVFQCGFPLDANFHFMQRICRYFFFAPATFIANPPPGTANFLDSFAYIVFWSHFHRKFLCQFATFGQKLGSFSLSIFNCCKQSSVMLQIDNVN